MTLGEVRPAQLGAAMPIAIAVASGAIIARSRRLSGAVSIATALLPALALGLAAATRRDERRGEDRHGARRGDRGTSGPFPSAQVLDVTILVPANNEAAVIADLLGDLVEQEGLEGPGAPTIRAIVIDDRSTDGTGEVATATIASHRREDRGAAMRMEVRRRPDGSATKGAALGWIDVGSAATTVVVVLDADARIGPAFVRDVIDATAAGVTVGTARRRTMAPPAGRLARLLAALQDDEQTVDGTLQLGRWSLGGAAELRGNGMIVRADILAAAGGWQAGALCEDLELSSRVYLSPGASKARWLRTLEAWEQPVTDPPALLRQRLRWAEGAVWRDLRVTLPSLRSRRIPLAHRIDVGIYAAQTLLPFAAFGALVTARGRALVGKLSLAYGAAAVILAFDSLRWSPGQGTQARRVFDRAARSVAVVAFGGTWLAIAPLAWLSVAQRPNELRFERTLHKPGFQPPDRAARTPRHEWADQRGDNPRPGHAEMEPDQRDRGRRQIPPTRHHEVARLPR